jgi:transcriptional regulator with XRE-family HTH domain
MRLDRDLTLQDVAKVLGYKHHQSVSQIESGYRPISDGKLFKVARFFGVQPLAIRRTEPDVTE